MYGSAYGPRAICFQMFGVVELMFGCNVCLTIGQKRYGVSMYAFGCSVGKRVAKCQPALGAMHGFSVYTSTTVYGLLANSSMFNSVMVNVCKYPYL